MPVLAVVLILNEPLPVRFAGVMFVTLSQLALLAGTFHVVLDCTVIVWLLAAVPGFHVDCETVSVGVATGIQFASKVTVVVTGLDHPTDWPAAMIVPLCVSRHPPNV